MNYYTGENEHECQYHCNGIIDTEYDFYGLKELVEYECQVCGHIEQNWERE